MTDTTNSVIGARYNDTERDDKKPIMTVEKGDSQ